MRAQVTVTCEVVGGPRDGDLLEVPGTEPPIVLRVILPPDRSRLYLYHPAVSGLPDMQDADMVVLDLDHRPSHGSRPWRYLWPPGGPS